MSVKRLPYHDVSQLAGISHRDRLVTAAFFVLLLHGILILGVTFSIDRPDPGAGTTVAVTLVQSRTVKAPDHADYIAQANQRGHGNTTERVRPSAPLANPAATANAGAEQGRDARNRAAPGQAAEHDASQRRAPESRQRIATTRNGERAVASGAAAAAMSDAPRLLIARLLTPSADAADPTEEKSAQAHATDKHPRDRTISVNARESRFARYLDSWRKRVVTVGNLNYPRAIRREHLSGHLSLEVALNADGTLREVVPVKPSKHAELNAAAIRIVRMAAPYPPFPASIRKDTDVLRFVYEWRFLDGKLSGH